MDDVALWVKLLDTYGPILLIMAVASLILYKVVPKMFNQWLDSKKQQNDDRKKMEQEARDEQRDYWASRQKQYDAQQATQNDLLQTIIKVAEQGTQALNTSNEVIKSNTEAIRTYSNTSTKMTEALARDLVKLTELGVSVKEQHDELGEVHADIRIVKEILRKNGKG